MDNKKEIEIYKAILRLDNIQEPFDNFGPNFPKIGDLVDPDNYFSYNFIYKLNKRPGGCPWTLEEIQSTNWTLEGVRWENFNNYMKFESVDKIKGRRRFITFKNAYNFTAEVVDMPEKAKLIIKYKNGELTLLELLKIFKEKKYSSRIHFKTILFDISGDEYLQAMTELINENNKQ
jgi:hypothetical protein